MAARTDPVSPLAISLVVLAFLCRPPALPAGPAATAPPAARLNLLLITLDTLRADRVGAYGSNRRLTPHLDGLAAAGAVFTRAFAHTPMTLPSHANILLGLIPPDHGVHDNANFVVPEEFLTLAELLGGQGYATGAFVGGFPLDSFFGLDQGFSVYDDSFGKQETGVREADVRGGERKAGDVWASAQKWLREQPGPWFLWVHFYDPHYPYEAPDPFGARFAGSPYDGEVAYTDAILGDLLDDLRVRALEASTLVVCVGDHGESLGEHGETTHGFLAYNATIWVPMVIRAPGIPPRIVSQNVSHVDIFPTVCDVLGVERPKGLAGVSLLPLMRGKRAPERPVYFEALSAYYAMGWAPLRGTVNGPSKFIDSPEPELYDLRRDFGETDNVAGGADVGSLRKGVEAILRNRTAPEDGKVGQVSDRATLEKLRSLGYVASLPGPKKKDFGPEDSVAAMLPYHNRAVLALERYRAGKTGEAVASLREILTGRKNVSAAYINLAHIYKAENRPADALSVLRLGLEALPENYEIHFQYLNHLYEAGRYDEVLGVFAEKGFPQSEFDPVVWNVIGLAHWKKGDAAQALSVLEKALAMDRQFAVTYANLGTVHFDVFQRTRRGESYDLAVDAFKKAAALDPGYGPAFHGLGLAYFQARDLPQAVESLEKALALDPGLDEAHLFLGSAYLELGRKSPAYEHLMKYRSGPAFGRLSPAAKKRLEDLLAACKTGK
jgi:arylsulfatase A-like enzyme/tetratricopeptide (TPR) repeat protein